tara:strand:+ start:291 stop:527 length:237 start_codon:yes stop_codon:yes gene_type:complete
MKSLYANLKPEVKARLYSQNEEYQNSVRLIINKLKKHTFYTDLRITDVQTLQTFSDTYADTVMDFKWGEHLFNNLYEK